MAGIKDSGSIYLRRAFDAMHDAARARNTELGLPHCNDPSNECHEVEVDCTEEAECASALAKFESLRQAHAQWVARQTSAANDLMNLNLLGSRRAGSVWTPDSSPPWLGSWRRPRAWGASLALRALAGHAGR